MTSKQRRSQLVDAANAAEVPEHTARDIRSWLASGLVADEYAKLMQGGHTKGEVPLQRVFVDLPVELEPLGDRRVLFLETFLRSSPIDLAAYIEADDASPPGSDARNRLAHRGTSSVAATLLIGGPGQGKSTLGQLACQLHRAALLLPYSNELTARERDVITPFEKKGWSARLRIPDEPSFPIHISLPKFAAWLAKREPLAGRSESTELMAFVVSQPAAVAASLSSAALLRLLAHIPLLLVLDGFDEIGATGDRQRVVASTRAFLRGLAQSSARIHVIATTRPQGYTGELGRLGLPLMPASLVLLDTQEALRYGKRLVEAKIADVDLQAKTIERLTDAAKKPATARLLTTPLQVTIVAALVQQQGRAPKERWRLFSSYFDYTYKREIERDSYASALLAEYRSHIEAIHARVGLLLQVEAERVGGASARMTHSELRIVVETVLKEDDVPEPRFSELVADILKAAEERLVFLVEPEPGRFGFEIRSLQEFMAAWALSQGPDADVTARMVQVSKSPMFRNVLLFVTSRLYSESSHLREQIPGLLCGNSNRGEVESPADQGGGALLALEILEEGAPLSQPRQAAALLERAVRVLDLPVGDRQARLARVSSDESMAFVKALETRVAESKGRSPALAAWVCLMEAVSCGRVWARPLAERFWSTISARDVILACVQAGVRGGQWMAARLAETVQDVPPERRIEYLEHVKTFSVRLPWLEWLSHTIVERAHWDRELPYLTRLRDEGRRTMPPPELDGPASWQGLLAVARFLVEPSAQSLSAALDMVASDVPCSQWGRLARLVTWPLAACLRSAATPSELQDYARRMSAGELGDISDWLEAESGWVRGVYSFEGDPWRLERLPEGPPLVAFPHWILEQLAANATSEAVFQAARAAFVSPGPSARRAMLAHFCTALLQARGAVLSSMAAAEAEVSIAELRSWLAAGERVLAHLVPRPHGVSVAEWIALLDEFKAKEPGFPRMGPRVCLDACVESGGHPVVASLAVLAIQLFQENEIADEPGDQAWLPDMQDALRRLAGATARDRALLGILRVYVGDVTVQDSETVEAIQAETEEADELFEALAAAALAGRLPRARSIGLIRMVLQSVALGKWSASRVFSAYLRLAQAETSGLDRKGVWVQLGLPSPPPSPGEAVHGGAGVPSEPVQIAVVSLRDVRGVHEVTIRPERAEHGLGQWIVILGENGTGKTTILRAIATSLRNARDPSLWPDDAFSFPWVRVGADEARIVVAMADGRGFETRIRVQDGLRIVQTPEHSSPRPFPVFGYGCRRGSALGGGQRRVDLGSDGGPEVATLFSEGRDIIHAETWLLVLDGDANRSVGSKDVLEVVKRSLEQLLDVAEVFVLDRRVFVREKNGCVVLFEALSDGYLTTAGWFVDFVARWVEMLVRAGLEVPPDFLLEARGLILIDEVDLHLHPRWQLDVITRIKQILPRMSFVVTTHNPLTLVGAKPGQIWILSPGGAGPSLRQGVDAPMLLSGGQVFRRYFGVDDIYPSEYGRKLQRYAFLSGLAKRSADEEAEMRGVVEELGRAGLLPEWDVGDSSAMAPAPGRKLAKRRGGA